MQVNKLKHQMQSEDTNDFSKIYDPSKINPKSSPFFFSFGRAYRAYSRVRIKMHAFHKWYIVLLRDLRNDLNEKLETKFKSVCFCPSRSNMENVI